MKHIYAFLLLLGVTTVSFAQEELGPITRYNHVSRKKEHGKTRAGNPIDSTFIYVVDTISLPVFDDFSVSHFQEYDAGFSDPNVTSQNYYKLLDPVTDEPLPVQTVYTTQQTFRTVVNTLENTSTNEPFPAVMVKYADFSAVPVQYSVINAYPAYNILDTISFPNPPDTIWNTSPEIFQDSARIFTAVINDPQSFWVDDNVYHNYTMAIDPWSLGVATFDGLDANGYPYFLGSTAKGIADYLTSKRIDLSGYAPSDSVYLSFLVQRGGNGDVPELIDSLVLEFYNQGTGVWDRQWAYRGGNDISAWKIVNLKVTGTQYFNNGFRMRFKNYGGLSGSLDHFHLDYVNLRPNGGYQDSIFEDFAWSYKIGSLIKTYTSVPWEHWQNNFAGKMNDKVKVAVHNSFPVNKNPAVSRVDVTDPQSGNSVVILDNGVMTAPVSTADYLANATAKSQHDFSGEDLFDPSIAGPEVSFDVKGTATIQEPTYLVNDTCYTTQFFGSYYSYDDGSAEKAYGITGSQARLAVKFTAYEPGVMLGVDMHFVPSVNDVSSKLFLLTVWADDNGKPGAVLYEDDFFNTRSPLYGTAYNEFVPYYFKDFQRLSVPQTFYVGWRQIDGDRLNIGFDVNNDNKANNRYSIDQGATWKTSTQPGSVMIRPVFRTQANFDLSVDEQEKDFSFGVFPNPTGGIVSIDWRSAETFPGAVCRDIQGRVIGRIDKADPAKSFDLSASPAGMYFIQLEGVNSEVKKVVRY